MPQIRCSIAERIENTGGHTSGFDYLRLCLALGVIAKHASRVSYGLQADFAIWNGPQSILPNFILPMFFALSGFLVAGSLERCSTLISFYGLRILRIVPALAVEVALSALILGPLLSSSDAASYFTSTELYRYFLNLVGDIHYQLPGLFVANPVPSMVNAQLWTVPFELQCYIALGGLAVAGITRRRVLLIVIVAVGQCLWAWQALKAGGHGLWTGPSGSILVLCFLTGVLFFLYREKIRLLKGVAALSLILCIALLSAPHGTYFVAIPVTYLTVYIGLLNPRRLKYILAGDFSYGLYLYGYPVQQTVASLGWSRYWYLNLVLSVPITCGIAFFSWYVVEKRALGLRRHLPQLEQKLLLVIRGRGQAAAAASSASAIGS